MANQGVPFQMDPFAQHLQDQAQAQAQAHRGAQQGFVSAWNDPQELHRQQNSAMLSQQLSAAHQHQMNQTHQGTPNTMNMLANRDLASQLQRQTPRAVHTVMGSQGQYPQLTGQQQQQQQAQTQFLHANMAQNPGQNMNLNTTSPVQNPNAHLMSLPQQQARTNPNSLPFTPAANYSQVLNNPALQRQFQNLQTGIANGPSQIQRTPSFSNPSPMQAAPNQSAVEFQRSLQMLNTVEAQFRELQQQAKSALTAHDIATLRSVKERLGEHLKRAQEERDKWQRSLANRAWPQDTIERIVAQISPLVQRWAENATKIEQVIRSLDSAIQQVAQQTLQNNRTPMGNMSQQQWNTGPRDVTGMQATPQQQSSHINPANPTLSFSNVNANNHPGAMNMNAMQHGRQSVAAGQGSSDQESIRRNLASILAGHSMEPTVFIAGHLVDLYNLFVVGRALLTRPGAYNNTQIWQAVGAQLGLPSEGNPPLASAQAAAALQEYYYKVNSVIEATKTNHNQGTTNQPGVTPPTAPNLNPSAPASVSPALQGGGMAPQQQQQTATNLALLQRAKQAYPSIDFTNITQQMLVNIPTLRFEQLLRDLVNKSQTSAGNGAPGGGNPPGNNGLNAMGMGTSAPPRPNSTVQIPRGLTPAGQPQDTPHQPQQLPGQGQQITFTPQQISEIRTLHQQVQNMWKGRYQTRENTVPTPPPASLQTYRERLSSCMALLRIFLPALGLRFFIKKDETELKTLVNFTVLIVKQLTGLQSPNGSQYYLSLESLSRIFMSLQPLANDFNAQLQRINITPELHAVMSSGEMSPRNLWGFMLQSAPIQRLGVPQPGPNQPSFPMVGSQGSNHGMQISTTPVPAPISTPMTHPVPTPPHHPGQPGGLGPLAAQRRGGFSEGIASSPLNHLTPPASNLTAHTPPAASPPKGKNPRRGTTAQKRRTSKAANTPTHVQTPTPATEPASTPATVATPAPSAGQKRSHDEAETPSNQTEHPSKRAKTETPQPPPAPLHPSQPPPTTIAPVMVKVPTPPPQLSAPIDRSQIKTEGDAKALVTESFNRSAEVDNNTQNPSDLLNFLNQLLNTAPAAAEPEASTSTAAPETEPLPATLADDGEAADLFDFGMYYADTGQSTVPDLEDKQNTVSPESHNDVTNTPPSQSNAPARAGAGATSKVAVAPKQEPQVNNFLDDDLLGFGSTFLEDTFSYSGPVNPLEEPWAIAQG